MSLKSFHLVFIIIAMLLGVVCAYRGWTSYFSYPTNPALWFSIGFSALAVSMFVYGIWFIKKARNIIV